MLRLFVALDLPRDARDRLALLQTGVPGARWVAPESLHVTLRFIGGIAEDQTEDLDAALGRISAPCFDLRLDGVGMFGSPRKPHALWAGVARSEPLRFLHDKIDRAAVAAGLAPDDRKYTPHVTLARLKGDVRADRVGQWLEANALFGHCPIPIRHFVMFRSHLGSAGASYEPLTEYRLEPAQPEPSPPLADHRM